MIPTQNTSQNISQIKTQPSIQSDALPEKLLSTRMNVAHRSKMKELANVFIPKLAMFPENCDLNERVWIG